MAISTISKHIKELEERLDLHLCDRGRTGFALSEHGKIVQEATENLFGALSEFRDTVNVAHEQIVGELRIYMLSDLMDPVLPLMTSLLKRFNQEAPGVFLEFVTTAFSDIEKAVVDGTAHIGMGTRSRPLPSIEYLKLLNESVNLYCGADHPLFSVPDQDLAQQDIYQYNYLSADSHYISTEVEAKIKPFKAMACSSALEPRIPLLLTGNYLCYLPESYARSWVEVGKLRPLLTREMSLPDPIYVMIKKGGKPNPALETFMTILKEELESFKSDITG